MVSAFPLLFDVGIIDLLMQSSRRLLDLASMIRPQEVPVDELRFDARVQPRQVEGQPTADLFRRGPHP